MTIVYSSPVKRTFLDNPSSSSVLVRLHAIFIGFSDKIGVLKDENKKLKKPKIYVLLPSITTAVGESNPFTQLGAVWL